MAFFNANSTYSFKFLNQTQRKISNANRIKNKHEVTWKVITVLYTITHNKNANHVQNTECECNLVNDIGDRNEYYFWVAIKSFSQLSDKATSLNGNSGIEAQVQICFKICNSVPKGYCTIPETSKINSPY